MIWRPHRYTKEQNAVVEQLLLQLYHCFSTINYFTTIICNSLNCFVKEIDKKYKRNRERLFVNVLERNITS
jgi:hypothetical protein